MHVAKAMSSIFYTTYTSWVPKSFMSGLVMFPAWPKAMGQPKPGLIRLGQAGPKSQPEHGFGLAWDPEKPKPVAQATAFGHLAHGT